MRIDKRLWHKGLILTLQHSQRQQRWMEFASRQFTPAALAQTRDTLDVEADEATRACQIHLPTSVPDVALELHAVPRS